jgi:hypothetical protein
MGHYSQLYIDRLYLSWNYDVPSFLTFLFDKTDFYSTKSTDGDYFEEIGYKTSCGKSLEVLDSFGYTVEFFAQVYDFFYDMLYTEYRRQTKNELAEKLGMEEKSGALAEEFARYVASFPSISRTEELRDFARFLAILLDTDFKSPPYDQPHVVELRDGRKYFVDPQEYLTGHHHGELSFVDFGEFQYYIFKKHLKFPPWILLLCDLFSDGFVAEYPEIISLMFVRLALEAVRQEGEIKLELADIIDEESEVRALHADLAQSLVDKVNLYNRVFRTLFVNEEEIRGRYIKAQCANLLSECDVAHSNYEKGYLLEHLTEVIFTSNNSLELIDKRVSTGDEEVDLVVKNNINRPFWLAFSSPVFFIECKNWSTPVGSKELRDFEVKLRNHAKLAKIGFFVSLNGFTSEVESELKRMGRDAYHIVLINRHDIDDYLSSSADFFTWLEKRAARFY